MDRDEAALVLFVLGGGALLWLGCSLVTPAFGADERATWRRVWLPGTGALVLFAFLFGFALSDPERPQAIGLDRLVAAVPFAATLVLAFVRVLRATGSEIDEPAVTHGLVRPRIAISDELRALLDQGELRAVIAHEEAHARHRDPLRIACVRCLTVLQWPFPSARARERAWLDALELARDAEAIRTPGVVATDLASALVKAAHLARPHATAGAALTRHEALLALRVERLLDPTTPSIPKRTRFVPVIAALVLLAFALGLVESGAFVARLAGVP